MIRFLRLWRLVERERRRTRPVPGVDDTGLVGWCKPDRPARGPGPVMSSHFYADGTVRVDDHIRRRTHRVAADPAGDFDWDRFAAELRER